MIISMCLWCFDLHIIIFFKNLVRMRTGGGSEPKRTHCVQGESRRSKFAKFVRTYFMDGPLIQGRIFTNMYSKYPLVSSQLSLNGHILTQ